METYSINFRSFSISNVCFQYYKFLSKHCFYCIPQILVNSSFTFIYFKLKKISLESSSEPMCYLEVCCLIFKYFEIPAIFLLLICNLILLWSEYTLCMMSNVLNLLRCVLSPRMWSILVNIPCELEKNVYSAVVG